MARRILNIASKAVLGLVVAAAVTTVVVLLVAPRIIGGAALAVRTGSMAPTIPRGSVVLVKPVDPQTLEAGDVITWQVRPGEATFITHRIVEVERENGQLSFITKGDANGAADLDPVAAGAVRGRVVFDLPHLGIVADRVGPATILPLLAMVVGFGGFLSVLRRLAAADSADAPPVSAPIVLDIALVTVRVGHVRRTELRDLLAIWNGRAVDVTPATLVVELLAPPRDIDRMCSVLTGRFIVSDVSRTSVSLSTAGAPDGADSRTLGPPAPAAIERALMMAEVPAAPGERRSTADELAVLGPATVCVTPAGLVVAIADDPGSLDRTQSVLADFNPATVVRSPIVSVSYPESAFVEERPSLDESLAVLRSLHREPSTSMMIWEPPLFNGFTEERHVVLD